MNRKLAVVFLVYFSTTALVWSFVLLYYAVAIVWRLKF